MRNWVLASLLALPCLALGQQTAHAQCYNIGGSFHIKICTTGTLKCWKEQFPSCYGPPNGFCGSGNCGSKFSPPVAPGPWYNYWPYAGTGYMGAEPMTYPGWTYESNFNAPAPTGYPWWPAAITAPPKGTAGGAAYPAPAYQAVGAYPSYWYGH